MSILNLSSVVYGVTGAALLLLLRSLFSSHSLRHIPTVGGPSAPLLSYIGVYNYIYNTRFVLQNGYDKYKGGMFKIPSFDRWIVVVTGLKLIDELVKFSDEQVSFSEGAGELITTKYMFGEKFYQNRYHVTVVRQQLTRHLVTIFPDVIDEIVTAFGEFVPAPTDGRNTQYLDLAINFTVDVSKGHAFIPLCPTFLKPLAARATTNIEARIQTCTMYLHELIQNRLRDMEKFGNNWVDKPNDTLQWFIEEEKKTGGVDICNVAQMLLVINFVAIHTSSSSFMHALYHLAASPELALTLHKEAETVLQEEGWTKAAMDKMQKLDSFMQESQCINDINSVSLMRKVLQDITFSDGTTLPAGTVVVTAAAVTHMDGEHYVNPDVFDPWQFSNMCEEDEEGLKHQFVRTAVDYVSFGHRKHACPGRFFAANELKAMMTYVIMNYDVKFEDEGIRPPNKWLGLSLVPDPTAWVLFRKRYN